MIAVVLFAASCSREDAGDDDPPTGFELRADWVPSSNKPQSEDLFDTYSGLLDPVLRDGTRAQFRMFEQLVFHNIDVECYRQIEELLAEGLQATPYRVGAELTRHRFLGSLVQPKKTMEDSNGNPFVLQLHDGQVRVVGRGPDGKMGTKDDDVYPADLKGRAWVFDKRPRQPER